ncbi:uncharacterized protein DUF4214 [Rhodovulum imhoffii]|uniref:Uncharacterized protein DUF4214 n=1 Tax=Rhodovulum imhoffii TaxID=365340 RepID=A0A2T5BPB6_9RHOB|nr:DUF4214 domain-containing protein [Rhodovulum imhoffii]MBK5932934.1 hypothetical protein [Rhodovulum imhoffii]PTN00870.1 uncharacterized protein DUF4214 [Rhodovulum imhoffii]
MPKLRFTGSFAGGPETHTTGISDLVSWMSGDSLWLFSASGAGGGLLAWRITPEGPVAESEAFYQAQGDGAAGLSAPVRLEVARIDGKDILLSAGEYGMGVRSYSLDPGQMLSGGTTLIPGETTFQALAWGTDSLFGATRTGPEIGQWRMEHPDTATFVNDADLVLLPDGRAVAGLEHVALGGNDYLLVLSDSDDSLTLMRQTIGGLRDIGHLDASGGMPVSGVTHLEVTQAHGQAYALVGAAGSGTVTVVALSRSGEMTAIDQVGDTQDTRFGDLTDLTCVTLSGRVFVIAAGGDDGGTLMELLPGGRLLHIETFSASAEGMAAGNVSALTAVAWQDRIEIFLARENGATIDQFTFDPGPLSPARYAPDGGGLLAGGTTGDLLVGGNGEDTLSGGAGDDILIDGGGCDILIGGDGADVFVFTPDGALDVVHDFTPGQDRLDLSALGRFYTLDALDFTELPNGIEITLNGETVRLLSSDGVPIRVEDLDIGMFRDLWHIDTTPFTGPGQKLTGTTASETLKGGAGNDTIIGGGGSDILWGGDGDDTLIAEDLNPDLDAQSAQVMRLYHAALGRKPDLEGIVYWIQQLADGLSEPELVRGFLYSEEFATAHGELSTEDYVTRIYTNIFARHPDSKTLDLWSEQLDAGLSRESLLWQFASDPDLKTNTEIDALRYSEAGLRAQWSDEIYRLFHATLGRDPTTADLLDWSAQLADGTSLTDAITDLKNCDNGTDTEFVRGLYADILGRAPDAEGMKTWLACLSDGMTRPEVLEGFLQSVEFREMTGKKMNAWMRGLGPDDMLAPGPGDSILFGGIQSDTFRFDAADGGIHHIVDLEGWDILMFEGFGYETSAQARTHMRQQGDDVLFTDRGVTIWMHDVTLPQITDDLLLLA